MFSKVYSGAVYGVEGKVITVEADISDGLPAFNMVGVLASEVKEASERVKTALRNSDYYLPPCRITVNLSPADMRKEGSAYDLPIAIAILDSLGMLNKGAFEYTLFIGELGLDGRIKPVRGVLSIVDYGRKHGFTKFVVPYENRFEGAFMNDVEVYGMKDLREVIHYINGLIKKESDQEYPYWLDEDMFYADEGIDFLDVSGQTLLKRAVVIAVAGMHNFLMMGPPGVGKSMIAKRIPTVMPPLSLEESIEITKIYSVAGLIENHCGLVNKRPYRSPHHSISDKALVGGGAIPKPGEISLAHHGVLFLDEFPEFSKTSIESLRQPLEDKQVSIVRVHGAYRYPANTMLVAAMNPCPCGYFPDRKRCSCNAYAIERYMNKLSQPILDRIDVVVQCDAVSYEQLYEGKPTDSSASMREKIMLAYEIQKKRFEGMDIHFNSQMNAQQMDEFCKLDEKGTILFKDAFERYQFSARGAEKIKRVARTIADLDQSEHIKEEHLMEAISYRSVNLRAMEV